MFFTSIRNIPEHVQSKAEPVWKAAHDIIIASRYLVMAYSALNQPDSLRVSLEQVKDKVQVFQDKMGEIVRWLPPTSEWRESVTTICNTNTEKARSSLIAQIFIRVSC